MLIIHVRVDKIFMKTRFYRIENYSLPDIKNTRDPPQQQSK